MLDEALETPAEHAESVDDRSYHMSLKRVWLPRTLLEQVDIILKCALLAAAIIAAVEYFDQRHDKRVERTLEFVARFDSHDYLTARAAVDGALAQKMRELRMVTAASSERQDSELRAVQAEKAALSIVLDGKDGKGLEPEMAEIAGLFSSLQVCIDQKLCDGEAAHAVFDPYAASLWQNFKPYFDQARASTPGFGVGLENFVRSARS